MEKELMEKELKDTELNEVAGGKVFKSENGKWKTGWNPAGEWDTKEEAEQAEKDIEKTFSKLGDRIVFHGPDGKPVSVNTFGKYLGGN